jgi:hypothetical protein
MTRTHGGYSRRAGAALAVVMAAALVLVAFAVMPAAATVGKPGPTTTGVPAGTRLTVLNGDLTITKAGAVYSALDIHGFVWVKAADVTIKNSIIRGGVAGSDVGLVNDISSAATNFVISDSELVPQHPSVRIDGIKGWNYTASRLNIHGTVDGAKVFGNNATLQDSYIHDLASYSSDPDQGGGPAHNDGIEILGGTHVRVLDNSFVIGTAQKSAVQVNQVVHATKDLWINGNAADGGLCTFNLTNRPLASMGGVTINNNHFGPHTPDNCAIIIKPAVTFTASGNIMDATGLPARIRIL